MLNERKMRTRLTKRSESITVRKPTWTFEDMVGKKSENEFLGLLFGSMSLVFPEGERFFIRSVKHFAEQITDKKLAEDVKLFIGQEAQHGKIHETFNKTVLGHFFDIQPFLTWYKKYIFGGVLEDQVIRLFGHKFALSATAAAEHFTAMWASNILSSNYLNRNTQNQQMIDFIIWHGIEEIEHKHVAFDVLQEVDDSYLLRASGMVFLSFLLPFAVSAAFISLARQRRSSNLFLFLKQVRDEITRGEVIPSFLPAFLEYFRPGFHPSDHDDYALARQAAEHLEQRMLAS